MHKLTFHVKHFLSLFIFFPIVCLSQHFSTTTFESKPFPKLPERDENILSLIQSNQSFVNLNEEKKDWFYWTSIIRLKPKFFYDSIVQPILNTYPTIQSDYSKSLKRDLYNTQPLSVLIPSIKLIEVSQNHANDLLRHKKSPSHNSTNGQSFQQRMIKYEVNRCAAENISYGPSNTIMALVLLLIDEGLPDLGHRKNLLSSEYSEMGIGISEYPGNLILVEQCCHKKI